MAAVLVVVSSTSSVSKIVIMAICHQAEIQVLDLGRVILVCIPCL